ncbi:hypothetical protein RRG08_011258 [Elysia crispata]|uniref:Uncharacterized protein n=1 Tax=Elysia crispata TaxID=231223 RepID=A0AAE1D1Y7_9GAST|nr:hypothetical protein RRG08_011258 [Elysia crispata]
MTISSFWSSLELWASFTRHECVTISFSSRPAVQDMGQMRDGLNSSKRALSDLMVAVFLVVLVSTEHAFSTEQRAESTGLADLNAPGYTSSD